MTGEELHEIMCNDSRPCARWLGGRSSHRDYYRDRAAELTSGWRRRSARPTSSWPSKRWQRFCCEYR